MSSSYQAYKKDTAILLQWLSDTAERCGFVSHAPAQKETPKPSQRLKGKDRKTAREAAGSGHPPKAAAHRGKRKASIKEFLSQAKLVAESRNPRVVVPDSIIKAGLRAVAARRRCGIWFEEHSAHSESSNQEHQFFIELLEEVISILSTNYDPPASKTTDIQKKADSRPSTDILTGQGKQTLDNLFNVLALEEPRVAPDVKPEDLPKQQAAGDEVSETMEPTISFEIEDEKEFAEENARFAVWSLYEDLRELREYLESIWSADMANETDLATASVITNTAFDLARRAEEDFRNAFPDLKSADEIILLILSPGPSEALAASMAFLREWIYREPYNILSSFRSTLASGLVAATQKGHIQEYNPRRKWSDMSQAEREREDRTLLQNLLPEFWLLNLSDAWLPAQDELTRGLTTFTSTKEIPVWLTFAIQIFLDIHHVMRDKTPQALHKLQEFGLDVVDMLFENGEYTKTYKNKPSWEKSNPQAASNFCTAIEMWAMSDFVLQLKKEYGGWSDISSPKEEFHLLKHHPILCGIMGFNMILKLHDLGVALAEGWDIMSMAHFYNTMRQQKEFPVKVWRDMDLMIAFQTEQHVFLGEAPKEMQDCFKKMCLMNGMSVASFAKTRRRNIFSASKKGSRGLRDPSPIVNFFNGAYLEKNSLDYTTRNIEDLLNLQTEECILQTEESRTQTSKHSRRVASTSRLSPQDFLDTLRDALNRELPTLLFSYIHLHFNSRMLIEDLHERLSKEFQTLMGDWYKKNDRSSICFDIIYIAADYHSPFVTSARWTKGRSRVLEEASQALNDLIDTVGGQVSATSMNWLVNVEWGNVTEAGSLFFETYWSILNANQEMGKYEDQIFKANRGVDELEDEDEDEDDASVD